MTPHAATTDAISVRKFRPGFRLSPLDVAVLLLGLSGFIFFQSQDQTLIAFVIGTVVAHFFLFCNVFRLGRALELAWAAVFTVLVAFSAAFDNLPWWLSITLILMTTVAVIVATTRQPSYHGVLWRKFNPSLPDWWEKQVNRN